MNSLNDKAMKKFFYTIVFVALAVLSTDAAAQGKWDADWKEKLMSEKIAFFTIELDITPEEAQVFWPEYNRIEKELDEARHAIMKARKELSEAVESGRPSKEISAKLDRFVTAKTNLDRLDNSTAEAYKKVLPVEKVARLYVAEEKFRRNYISKLHNNKSE